MGYKDATPQMLFGVAGGLVRVVGHAPAMTEGPETGGSFPK